jgi:hypothetical protein
VDCRDVVRLLSAELDGALSVDESQTVQAHLPSCPNCARRLALLSDTRRAFRSSSGELLAKSRHITAGALATVTAVGVVLAIIAMRVPERSPQPLHNANASVDCVESEDGRPGDRTGGYLGPGSGAVTVSVVTVSASCIVDVPPCSGAECARLLVPR